MTTTITIDEALKTTATELAKQNNVRGGFSGLVQTLLEEYIKINQQTK